MPEHPRPNPRPSTSAPPPPDRIRDQTDFNKRWLPLGSVTDLLREDPPSGKNSVKIGGQWYDTEVRLNGTYLVPSAGPGRTFEEDALDARMLDAAVDSLAAGAAFRMTQAQGATKEEQVAAMEAAAGIEGGLLGVRGRAPARAPVPRLVSPPTPQERIRYSPTTPSGQATGVSATLTKDMINTGTRVNQALNPPGWMGNGPIYKQDRGHMLAAQLGGSGQTLEQVVTMGQNTNRGLVARVENQVRRRVEDGEIFNYYMTPLNVSPGTQPAGLLYSGWGSRGDFTPVLIQNAPPRTPPRAPPQSAPPRSRTTQRRR